MAAPEFHVAWPEVAEDTLGACVVEAEDTQGACEVEVEFLQGAHT